MKAINSSCSDGTSAPGNALGWVFLALAAAGLLAACTYRGYVDTPATLKVSWFSYLNGDDIRDECQPGSRFRYRLIYNADYEKQLRSYEINSDGAGGAEYTARAMSGSGLDLAKLDVFDIPAWGGWQRSQTDLDPEQMTALGQALVDSGAFAPPQLGLRLYSDQYYWVSTLCHDGVFYFNAWLFPSASYDHLNFPASLYAHDRTGVSPAPPRKVGPEQRFKRGTRNSEPTIIFQMDVGETGFTGLANF